LIPQRAATSTTTTAATTQTARPTRRFHGLTLH
jgi:hypothetical protein